MYKCLAKDLRLKVDLVTKDYIIFLIIKGFSLNNNIDIINASGLGHYVFSTEVLTLKPTFIVVIIIGY